MSTCLHAQPVFLFSEAAKQRDGPTGGNRCCLVGVYLDLRQGNLLLELEIFLQYVGTRERNAEYRV